MQIKVKLRAIVNFFHLENESTREVFKDVLDEETLNVLETRYPTLGDCQEAEKRKLVSITNEQLYETMKDALSKYVGKLIIQSTYVSSSDYLLPVMKIAYGRLAEDAEIYFYPFGKVQDAIESLSEEQQKFLDLYYGFTGNRRTEDAIKTELKLSVPVEEYKRTVIECLRDNFH